MSGILMILTLMILIKTFIGQPTIALSIGLQI